MTTKAKLESLTGEQWAQVHTMRAEWLQWGMSTAPADRPAAEAAITEMYRLGGHVPPGFVWVDSPATAALAMWLLSGFAGQKLRASLRASLGDSLRDSLGASLGDSLRDSLRDSLAWNAYFWGQHEWWIAYYLVPHQMGLVTYQPADLAKLELWAQIARSCGWWWPHKNLCVISERPRTVHVESWDARRGTVRLHRAGGPTMEFRDGWPVHAWHGRHVPAWVVENPTMERIAAEPNVEVRRCAIEAMGWEQFTSHLMDGLAPLVCPDPGNPGQDLFLYEVPERLWGARVKLLLCTNGSPERDGQRRKYGLTVPPHVKDPLEAAAWTAGLTRDEYALMQRRT